MKITGKFEVRINPLDSYAQGMDGISLGRMSIDKSFSGDLEATSKGEMLTAMTSVKGSAGYVAIEQVSGILSGRHGSFVLQHFGTMDKGSDRLTLEVVQDSGTDELAGLTGAMTIRIEDGQHWKRLDFLATSRIIGSGNDQFLLSSNPVGPPTALL
ncbi:MAG: DUF3224 domain-containing protein [Gammaproteobacteria bacterium]